MSLKGKVALLLAGVSSLHIAAAYAVAHVGAAPSAVAIVAGVGALTVTAVCLLLAAASRRETSRRIAEHVQAALAGREVDAERAKASPEVDTLRADAADLLQRAAEAEEALDESEKRYRATFESAGAALAVTDADGTILMANGEFRTLLGATEADIRAAGDWLDFVAEPDKHRLSLQHKHCVTHGVGEQNEARFHRIDGGAREVLVGVRAVGDAGQRIVSVADITERKRVMTILREREELLDNIFESIADGLMVVNDEFRVTHWNRAIERITAVGRSEVLNAFTTPWELLHPGDDSGVEDAVRVAMSGREVYRDGVPIEAPDGARRFVAESYHPLRTPSGKITGVIGLLRDITDRKRAEMELLRAKEMAEAANAAKSEFLANVSHEIRTPMNGVLGMTELMMQSGLTDEQAEYMEMVRESADSLLAVINDILDFSKIEAGRMEIEAEPFDLRECMENAARSLAVRAHAKGLRTPVDIRPDVPTRVCGDAGRLRQILVNLIGNAVKFTDAGEIAVGAEIESLDDDAAVVHFTVRDTGVGVPPEKHQSIFQAFTQADGSTTRRYGGTGLGLTICSKLVDMLGGRIWVDSEVGVGSVFHFTARLARLDDHPTPAPAETEAAAAPKLPPLRILVAEDTDVNRKLIVGLLKGRDHVLTVVSDGRQAVEAAEGETFDVILMDVQMPVMDGLQATAAIRAAEARTGRHTPILAMTAHAMKQHERQCLDAGMDGYVSKPLQANQLLGAIAAVVTEKAANRPAPSSGKPDLADADEPARPAGSFDAAACLARVGGDAELLAEMAAIFLESCPEMIEEIRAALADCDGDRLARAAHTFKGSVGNFHACTLIQTAKKLERLARTADLAGAQESFALLNAHAAELTDELRRYAARAGARGGA